MDWKPYAIKLLLSPAVWVGAVKLADAVVFWIWPSFPTAVSDAAQYLLFAVAAAVTGVEINNERRFQAQARAAKVQVMAQAGAR